MDKPESRTAIIAALIGNFLIAITKGIAAVITGSSAMISESVHSLVDSGNEVLLLYGQHRSSQPPDETHPLGYGRELYFWCFVVALLVFALGAGISIYEGVIHIRNPEPIRSPLINFAVLGLAFIFEGVSWWFAWRNFQRSRGSDTWWEAVVASKDPTTFTVLFEDTAALIGIVIAAVATFLSVQLNAPWIDGTGSILIGAVLAAVAIVLARESKALLIGERADPELSRSIRKIASRERGVRSVRSLLTSQLAPDQVIATLSIEFDDELTVPSLEKLVANIEDKLRHRHPELFRVFVRPEADAAGKMSQHA